MNTLLVGRLRRQKTPPVLEIIARGARLLGARSALLGRAPRTIPRLTVMCVVGALGLSWWTAVRGESQAAAPTGEVTFTKDIAPLVFAHCASCHRPEGSAPLSLLTYADVKRHAHDIATLTANRSMPPWKPEPGYGDFMRDRKS